jgi:hypothetical protein
MGDDLYPVNLDIKLKIPHSVLEDLVGRPDDDSPEWLECVEQIIQRKPFLFLTYSTGDPEVKAG